MGGAVALLLHRKKPDYWDGAILAAPMCKVRLLFSYFVLILCKIKYIILPHHIL